MIEKEVIVTTQYGKMPTFAACPDGPGEYPGIIFYMEAPGIREELRNIPGELKKALEKVDVKHELKVFPGTQHGFCFPERAVYDTLAAEEAWSKIFAMWDRRLK